MSLEDDNGNCTNTSVKLVKFNLNRSIQVCKILIHTNMRLTKNDAIFIMIDLHGQRQTFLSPISGIVTKLYIHELDNLSYDSIIFEYEECQHTIIFKNLCADCGIDLNQLNEVLSIPICDKSIITPEPSFSQLTITRKEGLEYDNEERNYLLQKHKLHLLIVIDQTLVHTTNAINPYPFSPDIIAYQLNSSTSQTFYTKLRPGVREFLHNLHSFYQFHLVTFGDRSYANTIAKLIDRDKIFFSHRILSHNECLSLTEKTVNLTNLFPYGDSLMCIIDVREDVWNYAPNLIQCKPYIWFRDVGHTNTICLPSSSTSYEQMNQSQENNEQISTINNSNIVEDTDLYLHQLEIILKRIHTEFYVAYDQRIKEKHGTMPDLKQIIPNIRRQILNSVSLCFSHLMPQNYALEKHPGTLMAQAMGAKVTNDVQLDQKGIIQTTHIIAGKRTFKVYQAQQNNIKVVTPEWLTDCYEQWEKKPEENYIFTKRYKVRKSRLFLEETPRVTVKRHRNKQQTTTEGKSSQTTNSSLSSNIAPEDLFNQYNFSMNRNECFNIEKEVNDLCIEDDDDDSNDIHPKPSKQQRTMSLTNIFGERKHDNDNKDFDLDSTSIYKLDDLILDKKDDCSLDAGSLDNDDVLSNKNQAHR